MFPTATSHIPGSCWTKVEWVARPPQHTRALFFAFWYWIGEFKLEGAGLRVVVFGRWYWYRDRRATLKRENGTRSDRGGRGIKKFLMEKMSRFRFCRWIRAFPWCVGSSVVWDGLETLFSRVLKEKLRSQFLVNFLNMRQFFPFFFFGCISH